VDNVSPDTSPVRDPHTYAVIGAAMEVHRELGCGFLESVYEEALAIELERRSIPYQRQLPLPVRYKGQVLTANFRADFLCYESVLVELKAVVNLTAAEDAQVLNYLKATGIKIGLLFNFAEKSLFYKRYVL
jgi:GxxExxY protein